MTINTKQAGSILKVTGSTICNLVNAGKLKDVSGKTTTRHEILLDSREVQAFKKIYKKQRHYKNIPAIPEKEVIINQVRNQLPVKYPEMVNKPIDGIMTRLGNIETKLNLLIKMWS